MSIAPGFYIGSKGTLYFKHENGRLTRFGVRLDEEGLHVFDPIQHRWYDVPGTLETLWKTEVTLRVEEHE